MSSNHTGQLGKIGFRLMVSLLLAITAGFFCSVADAKSDSSKLMDQMKIQFHTALKNGDVVKAKDIWTSIDSNFQDKFDKLAVRSMISSSAAAEYGTLNKLLVDHPARFRKMVLFLSSINQNFMGSGAIGTTGVLSGRIRDYKTRKGIADAKVVISGHETTTNGKGEFTLNGLPEGVYDLFAFATGYKLNLNWGTQISASGNLRLSLRLHAADYIPPTQEETRAKMNAVMTQLGKALKPAKSTGTETIEGTLLDADTSAPIAKAQVIMGCQTAVKSTNSDAQGHFVLKGIPTEVCNFTVMQSNVTFANMLQKAQAGTDRSYGFSAKYKITAHPNHTLVKTWKIKAKGIDLGGTVKGVVLNTLDDTPVPEVDVQVIIHRVGLAIVESKNAKSDAQGRFEIQFIPAGEYTIEANKKVFNRASQPINIVKGKSVAVTLKLAPITVGGVTGIALNASNQKPLTGVKITVGTKTAMTDAQGRFKLVGIDAGKVTVGGSKAVFKAALQAVTVQAAKSVDVTLKLEPITVGVVTGVVLNAVDQKPLSNVEISLGVISTTTNAQGRFKMTDVQSGEAKVEGSKAVFKPASQNVKVEPAKSVDVTLKLVPITVGVVTGVALNATNQKPLNDVRIMIGAKFTTTDVQGRFKLTGIDTGKVRVEGSKAVFKSAAKNVTVQPAKNVGVTLKLAPITVGDITGVALNADDQKPLAGVKVTMGVKTVITDAQGRFKFSDIDASEVTIDGIKAVFKPASQGVKVEPAKSVVVTLNLSPITVGEVAGVALNATNQKPLAEVKISLGSKVTATDAEGHFKLVDIDAGDVTVGGSKAVFRPVSQNVTVQPAKMVNITLQLEPITVGEVTGVALNATDHKPLVGVQISVGASSAVTDTQGQFKLVGIDAGEVTVEGSKAAFKPASQSVKILAAKSVAVTLKLPPITVGEVTGVVLSAADQTPLTGVKVTVGTKIATTDAKGHFKLSDIDAGDVMVEGSKAVFKPASQGMKILAAKSVAVTLKLVPITVGDVTGVVLNAINQKPLVGVRINIGSKLATTDGEGHFKLVGINAGDTMVEGSKAVFKPASKGVKVEPAKSVVVILKLAPITVGEVTGIALNAVDQMPLAGVKISVGTKTAVTDTQGHFKLSDINASDVTVEGSKAVFKPASQSVKILAAKSVAVTLKLSPITVGEVTGVALNAADQKPLAGVKVVVGTKIATTDAQGYFKFSDINAGDVTVEGSKAVFKPASQGVKVLAAKSVDVTLKLMPITTASIRGIVVDKKNKKPIKGVRVSTGNKADETDAAGRFSLKYIDIGKVVLISRHIDYKTDEYRIELKAGHTYDKKVEMERRREDVVELERALKEKGTVDLYGIHFDSGKDQFLPSSLPTLQAVSEVIKADSKGVFEVSGHTDSDGRKNYNQNLSERRARTVIRWLINHGVRTDQLKGKGYGETKPVVPNNTEAGKALNRRVQLRVTR